MLRASLDGRDLRVAMTHTTSDCGCNAKATKIDVHDERFIAAGTVRAVHARVGDRVARTLLIEIDPAS